MCDSVTRRGFLGGTLGGFFAYALRHAGARGQLALSEGPQARAEGEGAGKARRLVVLWMDGGPSQLDTFDPKPGEPTGGGLRAIETAVRGVRISEHLPEIARRMKKLSILRSLNSKEGDHLRGQYLLHTGYPLVEGFPRPAAGAVVSSETAPSRMPKYVSLGAPGFGPAYLGASHAPFSIDEPRQALQTLRAMERRKGRIELMRSLDRAFDEEHPAAALERRQDAVRKIEELLDTPFVRALDLEREPAGDRERYGAEPFGQRCLAARRLLEAGVPFVEVHQGGWDTHLENFAQVKDLCGRIDGPWAALLDDLEAKGLLAETLVVWMGEFGRTPEINVQKGRDHYPKVTCAVLGGGGIAGGRVVGETSRGGTEIVRQAVGVPDLFATLFSRLGIDPKRRFRTEFGGTATATDGGTPIQDLLA
jgi:hypothetical protein